MIAKDGYGMKKVIQIVVLIIGILFSGNNTSLSYSHAHNTNLFWTNYASNFTGKINHIIPIHYKIKQSDLKTTITKKGFKWSLPGSLNYYFPESPILPYIPISITLASGESLSYIKTISNDYEIYSIENIPVARNPKLQSTDGEPVNIDLLPNLSNTIFPSSGFLFSIVSDKKANILSLKLFPIHLDQKKFYLSTQLDLEVGINQNNKGSKQNVSGQYAIILTPDVLIEEAMKLKDIQKLDGYKVEVMELSAIKQNYLPSEPSNLHDISCFNDVSEGFRNRFKNYDSVTALQIRSYLKEAADNKSFQFITILGDASYIPPSDYIFSLNNKDSYDRGIPSDFFYMSPYAQDSSFPFAFNIGRLPVRSKTEAKHIVEKIQRYHQSFKPDWYKKVSLFGGDLFENDYYGELLNCYMIDQNDFQSLEIQKFFQTEQLYNRDTILTELEKGNRGFLYINSHGRGDYLRLPKGYVDSNDIQKLTQKDTLPIFVSDACLNGSWDTRLSDIRYGTDKNFEYPTSFSEALLFSEGGAIAYIGGSRINYAGMDYDYSKGVLESYNVYNIDALIHYIFQSYSYEDTSLGEISRKGLMTFIQKDWDWPGDWLLKTVFGFCLLGDPTLRLPGKQKRSTIDIDFVELPVIKEMNSGDIPFIQIDKASQFQIESKAGSITVHLSNYNSWDNALISTTKIVSDKNNPFTYTIENIPKTRICIRIEALNGSEKRFVAFGKYENDLVIEPFDAFHNFISKDKRSFQFEIVNDGLNDANKVKISIKNESIVLVEKEIPFLQSSVHYFVKYNLDFSEQVTKNINIFCEPLPGEKSLDDNSLTVRFKVEENPGLKIGIFKSLYNQADKSIRSKLWLDTINHFFSNKQINAEVKLLTLDECLHLDKQNLNKVIIYDSRYFQNNEEFLASLKKFTKNRGTVLVIGPTSKEIMKLCGISADDSFLMNQGDSSFQLFSILRSYRGKFTLPLFTLPCFESYAPEESNLLETLDDAAIILGKSDDNKLYLIQNKNAFYFSGLLSGLDFERQYESFQFFIDLLLLQAKN